MIYKRFELGDDIGFTAIVDDKFKSSSLAVYFITELNEKTAAVNNLGISILTVSSSKYRTYASLCEKLSELYGGIEGQALLDAVTAEHTLIGKLTASGMTYEQIGELADNSAADKYGKQMSFSESNHSYSE